MDGLYFYATDETNLGLVLTPACDFEQRKVELVQLCLLRDAFQTIEALIRWDWKGMGLVNAEGNLIPGPLGKTKEKDLSSSLRQLIHQRFPRYHWLPPLQGSQRPIIADFQVVASLHHEELESTNIVAALESPFREAVPARYAAYMGRVGTPDYSQADIDSWVGGAVAELFPTPTGTP